MGSRAPAAVPSDGGARRSAGDRSVAFGFRVFTAEDIGTRYSRGPFGPNGEFLSNGNGNECLDAPEGYVAPDEVDTSGAGPDGDPRVFWEKYTE